MDLVYSRKENVSSAVHEQGRAEDRSNDKLFNETSFVSTIIPQNKENKKLLYVLNLTSERDG